MKYFSDVVIDFLKQNEFDYACFNPGASFRGIHDSLVEDGQPEIIMCCHEEISVAIAHGYYKASGRHMAVMVHANIGLQHASMAMFNAWCDRVPMLVIGGNGPSDAVQRRPWIDWIHTSQGVDVIVKDFVKWSDQPTGQGATLESLSRAVKLTRTSPTAPVFVAVDSGTQEEEAAQSLPEALVVQVPALPPVGSHQVDALVTALMSATSPALIVDYAGKSPSVVKHLVSIAETLGAPVVDRGNRFNFPNSHPLSFVDSAVQVLRSADVILAVDVQDLWGALRDSIEHTKSTGTAKPLLATLDDSGLLVSNWAADYQRLVNVDMPLLGDSATTLSALDERLLAAAEGAGEQWVGRRNARVAHLTDAHASQRAAWRTAMTERRGSAQTHVSVAVAEIFEEVRNERWMLTNTGSVTIDSWVKRLWTIESEGSYIGLSGGAGLGYGLGASVGAALAHKEDETVCINLQADGDMLYTPSALWTLSQYSIPLLIIVMNNKVYLNSKQHAEQIAGLRSRDVASATVGTSFLDNPVDFVHLAQAFSIATVGRAESEAEIRPKVRQAIDYIKQNRKPVLLELVMD